ncbi:MAG: branched-chain amino acid ABC transporter permease [Comamonadaceae bacterium]|nr:MAG: branched-chain amino acid ABC transporter permease [Comamonadaceae bacterium]
MGTLELDAARVSQRRQDRSVDTLRYRIAGGLFAALILALLVVPMISSNASFAFYLMVWIAMATGMNICVGFTGYLPFGYVVFYGVGAYATGICYKILGLPIAVSLGAAGVAGVVIALLMTPTLRLKGVYFGIVSLGLATVVRLLISNLPDSYTGGSMGLILAGANNPIYSYYTMLLVVTFSLIAVLWLSRSRLGKQLRAIKDDEGAAACVGIDVPRARLKAWVLAAIIPALVGGVEAWHTNVVDPEYSFHVLVTAKSIIYGMAGGFGTIIGPVVGTIALFSIDHLIWERFPLINLMLLGLVIIVLMLFLPRGFVGSLLKHKPGLRRYIA